MTISAIQNGPNGDDIFHQLEKLPPDLRAYILQSLTNVVEDYLKTVQKNHDKIAAQDAADRRSKQEEARLTSIDGQITAENELNETHAGAANATTHAGEGTTLNSGGKPSSVSGLTSIGAPEADVNMVGAKA